MIEDKELIRRALLGSWEAQQACTDKGIVLPCPCCKGEAYTETFFERKGWRTVVGCSECPVSLSTITYDTEEIAQKKALKDWNTRPAPPIGRCKDCVWSREPTKEDYAEIDRDVLAYKDSLMCGFCEDARWKDDFCSYFQPK